MKILYLRDENYNWKEYEYENLSDLNVVFSEKKISIGDGASIGNRASIGDEVKLITGLFISGSKYPITYVGGGKISIGCHTQKISQFKKNGEELAKKEGYTDAEIVEYKVYVSLCEQFDKTVKIK